MKNFKAVLCYDGTRYRGWQRQGNTDNTIQAKLETTLSRLLEQPIEVAGSGRTDAGAHAMGQVISFRACTEQTAEAVLAGLRAYLPQDIGVFSVEEMPPRFHARLSAWAKTYHYRIWNTDAPNVFARNYVWQVPEPLDLTAMREAAQRFLGTHDFAAFCSAHGKKKSTVRTIHTLELVQSGDELCIQVTGDGFLYNMVRIIVGTLVEIGKGTRTADSITATLETGDRQLAGMTAPAQGLCLMEVFY
jgi:tRNA pseudouridine38-40 synthase